MTLLGVLVLAPVAAAEVGDQEFASGAWGSGIPPQWNSAEDLGWYRELDLQELLLSEDPSYITFALRTGGPPGSSEGAPDVQGAFSVRFQFEGQPYELNFTSLQPPNVEFRRVSGSSFVLLTAPNVTYDDSIGEWRVQTLKQDIRSPLDEPVLPGKSLTHIHAVAAAASYHMNVGDQPPAQTSAAACLDRGATSQWATACAAKVRDRLPDAGYLPDLALEAPAGDGSLMVSTSRPIRGSNGEATTHVFPIFVHSLKAQDVEVTVHALPEGWALQTPETLQLGAGETKQIIAALQVPFRHQHGGQQEVELEFQGDEQASLKIGVRWLEIPQPAGHHATLYFHAAEDLAAGWMNTLHEQDGALPDARIGGRQSLEPGTGEYRATFTVPLEPALVLGLDAMLDREGMARLAVDTGIESPLDLSGTIVATRDGSRTTLFELDPATIAPGEDAEVAIRATEAADFWPSSSLTRVEFVLSVITMASAADIAKYYTSEDQPLVRLATTGSFLRLPLQDYHEPVPPAAAGQRLEVRLVDDSNLELNAGTTRIARLTVHADADDPVKLRLSGHGAPYARLSRSDVSAPWPAEVLLRFDAPVDAQPGDTFEVVAIGGTALTSETAAIVAFRIVEHDVPNDKEEADRLFQEGSKRSPSVAISVLVLILGGLGRWRTGKVEVP